MKRRENVAKCSFRYTEANTLIKIDEIVVNEILFEQRYEYCTCENCEKNLQFDQKLLENTRMKKN